MQLNVFTDGGSRGNPGDAAIGGIVLNSQKELVYEFSKYVGTATNNEAEYSALLHVLEWVSEYSKTQNLNLVTFSLDSKLVVEQINRNWKIKEVRMQVLAKKCWEVINTFKFETNFVHVRREFNKEADLLVNQALDAHQA